VSAEGRWIRLQADYLNTRWLEEIGYPFNRLWPDVLCHVKLYGNNRGATKSLSVRTFARITGAPDADVQTLLDAAFKTGALLLDGDRWIIASWADYQSPDAERKRKERTGQSADVPDIPKLSRTNATCPVSCHATLTETETKTGEGEEPPKPPSAPKERKPAFVRPTEIELVAYIRELGGTGELARKFWLHYESNGWKVGRNPMKSWKAAAENWVTDDRTRGSPKGRDTSLQSMSDRALREAGYV
jgi:hypothetical protein